MSLAISDNSGMTDMEKDPRWPAYAPFYYAIEDVLTREGYGGQTWLSAKVGFSQSYFSEIIGKKKYASLKAQVKIAAAFDCTLDAFFARGRRIMAERNIIEPGQDYSGYNPAAVDRFNRLQQRIELPDEGWAHALKITPDHLDKIRAGEPISLEVLERCRKIFGANPWWILTGQGDMIAAGTPARSKTRIIAESDRGVSESGGQYVDGREEMLDVRDFWDVLENYVDDLKHSEGRRVWFALEFQDRFGSVQNWRDFVARYRKKKQHQTNIEPISLTGENI